VTALLLDTYIALWWWRDMARLSPVAIAAIEDGDTILVSAASAYEITQKWRIGKLPMIDDPATNYPKLMLDNDFVALAITQEHTIRAGLLPGEHRDPFDRLIAAQALIEGLTIVTRDPEFSAFGCQVLW